MKYNIHPEFKQEAFTLPFNKVFFRLSRFPQKLIWLMTKIPKEVTLKKIKKNGLRMYIFSPKTNQDNMPCILYFHGGAFVYQAAFHHKQLLSEYALGANCKVIMLDYSLMPRKIFPVAEEETLRAYQYILSNAESLSIDKDKIAIGGDSVGGYLTISLGSEIIKHNLNIPIMQLLIYPSTNPKEETASLKKYIDTPRWNAINNKKMWKEYFKNVTKEERENTYLENRKLLKTKTYLELTEFDPLHDEGTLYQKKLEEMNTPVTITDTKRTIHGYDIDLKSSITKENIKKRIQFLKDGFK